VQLKKMAVDLPEGFAYQPNFLTESEEQKLLQQVWEIPFSEVRMRGVVARRRVAHFGWLYGYETWQIEPGPPIPPFLLSLKERAQRLARLEPNRLVEALITEYSPGAGIGWHRDAPVFGIVIAVSLLSPCRFRLRSGPKRNQRTSLIVEPRSAYVLRGEARSRWEHNIPTTKALRYSITFRTLRSEDSKFTG
jgi:alkylated DNA repair protein (DNA oxidative demethylase)